MQPLVQRRRQLAGQQRRQLAGQQRRLLVSRLQHEEIALKEHQYALMHCRMQHTHTYGRCQKFILIYLVCVCIQKFLDLSRPDII